MREEWELVQLVDLFSSSTGCHERFVLFSFLFVWSSSDQHNLLLNVVCSLSKWRDKSPKRLQKLFSLDSQQTKQLQWLLFCFCWVEEVVHFVRDEKSFELSEIRKWWSVIHFCSISFALCILTDFLQWHLWAQQPTATTNLNCFKWRWNKQIVSSTHSRRSWVGSPPSNRESWNHHSTFCFKGLCM